MTSTQSVETIQAGLEEALAESDWLRAGRYIERLVGIIIDGVAQNDPTSIQSAGNALQRSGERLELQANLAMATDATALAWQLRADAVTAVLAGRVRPGRTEADALEVASGVPDQLMRALRRSNAPMSNAQLSASLGKDPATVSRGLKRLELDGKIRRWRSNGRQLNMPSERARWSHGQFNTSGVSYDEAMINQLKETTAQPASYGQPPKPEFDLTNKKITMLEAAPL